MLEENQLTTVIESLTEKERNALKAAISVIWLNDRSDYLNGLWDVVRAILGSECVDDEDIPTRTIVDVVKPFEN